MNQVVSGAERLTRAAQLTAGFEHATFEQHRERRTRRVRTATQEMIKCFERLADAPITVKFVRVDTEDEIIANDEELRARLQDTRRSVVALERAHREFGPAISRYARDLLPAFTAAVTRAITKGHEIQAACAFFLGEDDYRQLGFEPIPDPPAPGTAQGPSRSLAEIVRAS